MDDDALFASGVTVNQNATIGSLAKRKTWAALVVGRAPSNACIAVPSALQCTAYIVGGAHGRCPLKATRMSGLGNLPSRMSA